jgi:hypothetical protein
MKIEAAAEASRQQSDLQPANTDILGGGSPAVLRDPLGQAAVRQHSPPPSPSHRRLTDRQLRPIAKGPSSQAPLFPDDLGAAADLGSAETAARPLDLADISRMVPSSDDDDDEEEEEE